MLKNQKPSRRAAPPDADPMPRSRAAVPDAARLTFECLPSDQLLIVAQVSALAPVSV
ncbi:hypothetical protein AWB64_00914 [Caballeronia sordidicola]|uniref:Uncharacterized protein n=1 Tax=Caballeronia sordidicola TaxID=196367 RepID=A0A158F884_CABSO|nr:hypothetical protein AWB64_00914 [Caballeronia sordidicola]